MTDVAPAFDLRAAGAVGARRDAETLRPGSAMTAGLSLSWATDFNTSESDVMHLDFESLRDVLGEFDTIRDFFMDDFYQLTAYSTSESDWRGYQLHDAGVALAFRRSECADDSLEVSLSGLNPSATYLMSVDEHAPVRIFGAELAAGIPLTVSDRPAACFVRYATDSERRISA